MFGRTWSERSTSSAYMLEAMLSDYIGRNNLPYDVKQMMSGFNDRLVVTPKNTDHTHDFASLIFGWFNGDAELGIVRKYDNDKWEFKTNHYLQYDNTDKEYEPERSHLTENNVKLYDSPFDDRIDEMFDDITDFMEKQI